MDYSSARRYRERRACRWQYGRIAQPIPNTTTMWIECTETNSDGLPVVRRLKVGDEFVEFSDNGKANVSADIGEELVSRGPRFEAASDDESDDDSADADDDDDGADGADN